MKKICLIIYLIFVVLSGFSQTNHFGSVISKDDSLPIPYVNIGIVSKNVGTVSNENGIFEIKIDTKYYKDSLRFSSIGYISKTYLVETFLKDICSEIYLDKTTYHLAEVDIKPQKYKNRRIGNKLKVGIPGSFGVDQLGNEIGIFVDLHGKTSRLNDFNFYLSQNKCDTLLFRLNIYYLEDSVPVSKILKENLFIKTAIKKGLVTVNLEKYNLILNDNFVITLEWLKKYDNDCIYLRFRPGISTVPIYGKVTSHGKWKISKKVGIEFFVNVKQYKTFKD